MRRQVEPKRVPGRSEALDELAREGVLRGDLERAAHELVLPLDRVLGHERDELGLEDPEDRADVLGTSSLVVLVEEDVVRIVIRREALDPPELKLENPLERGPKLGEVAVPREPSPTSDTTRPAPERTQP